MGEFREKFMEFTCEDGGENIIFCLIKKGKKIRKNREFLGTACFF